MMREEVVFGPISSRRLGVSLGVNLLPRGGKLCNFDCVYCECGWNSEGTSDRRLPTADEVLDALESRLSAWQGQGAPLDTITFAGSGEPTLHPDFPAIIDRVVALRDRLVPSAKVSVLSNATNLRRKGVFEALCKVDNPILKLDAPTDAAAALVNRPVSGYHVEDIVRELERFQGNFVLQTLLLSCPSEGWASEQWIQAWIALVLRLRPREVMVYAIDRETPMKGLVKYSAERMREMTLPLREAGISVGVYG